MVVKLAEKSYVFKKQRKSLKGKQMEILGRRFECTLWKSNAEAEKSAQQSEEKRVEMRAKQRGDNKQPAYVFQTGGKTPGQKHLPGQSLKPRNPYLPRTLNKTS